MITRNIQHDLFEENFRKRDVFFALDGPEMDNYRGAVPTDLDAIDSLADADKQFVIDAYLFQTRALADDIEELLEVLYDEQGDNEVTDDDPLEDIVSDFVEDPDLEGRTPGEWLRLTLTRLRGATATPDEIRGKWETFQYLVAEFLPKIRFQDGGPETWAPAAPDVLPTAVPSLNRNMAMLIGSIGELEYGGTDNTLVMYNEQGAVFTVPVVPADGGGPSDTFTTSYAPTISQGNDGVYYVSITYGTYDFHAPLNSFLLPEAAVRDSIHYQNIGGDRPHQYTFNGELVQLADPADLSSMGGLFSLMELFEDPTAHQTPTARIGTGVDAFEAGNYGEAFTAFERAVVADPANEEAWRYLLESYRELGGNVRVDGAVFDAVRDSGRYTPLDYAFRMLDFKERVVDGSEKGAIRDYAIEFFEGFIEDNSTPEGYNGPIEAYLMLAKFYRWKGDRDNMLRVYAAYDKLEAEIPKAFDPEFDPANPPDTREGDYEAIARGLGIEEEDTISRSLEKTKKRFEDSPTNTADDYYTASPVDRVRALRERDQLIDIMRKTERGLAEKISQEQGVGEYRELYLLLKAAEGDFTGYPKGAKEEAEEAFKEAALIYMRNSGVFTELDAFTIGAEFTANRYDLKKNIIASENVLEILKLDIKSDIEAKVDATAEDMRLWDSQTVDRLFTDPSAYEELDGGYNGDGILTLKLGDDIYFLEAGSRIEHDIEAQVARLHQTIAMDLHVLTDRHESTYGSTPLLVDPLGYGLNELGQLLLKIPRSEAKKSHDAAEDGPGGTTRKDVTLTIDDIRTGLEELQKDLKGKTPQKVMEYFTSARNEDKLYFLKPSLRRQMERAVEQYKRISTIKSGERGTSLLVTSPGIAPEFFPGGLRVVSKPQELKALLRDSRGRDPEFRKTRKDVVGQMDKTFYRKDAEDLLLTTAPEPMKKEAKGIDASYEQIRSHELQTIKKGVEKFVYQGCKHSKAAGIFRNTPWSLLKDYHDARRNRKGGPDWKAVYKTITGGEKINPTTANRLDRLIRRALKKAEKDLGTEAFAAHSGDSFLDSIAGRTYDLRRGEISKSMMFSEDDMVSTEPLKTYDSLFAKLHEKAFPLGGSDAAPEDAHKAFAIVPNGDPTNMPFVFKVTRKADGGGYEVNYGADKPLTYESWSELESDFKEIIKTEMGGGVTDGLHAYELHGDRISTSLLKQKYETFSTGLSERVGDKEVEYRVEEFIEGLHKTPGVRGVMTRAQVKRFLSQPQRDIVLKLRKTNPKEEGAKRKGKLKGGLSRAEEALAWAYFGRTGFLNGAGELPEAGKSSILEVDAMTGIRSMAVLQLLAFQELTDEQRTIARKEGRKGPGKSPRMRFDVETGEYRVSYSSTELLKNAKLTKRERVLAKQAYFKLADEWKKNGLIRTWKDEVDNRYHLITDMDGLDASPKTQLGWMMARVAKANPSLGWNGLLNGFDPLISRGESVDHSLMRMAMFASYAEVTLGIPGFVHYVATGEACG